MTDAEPMATAQFPFTCSITVRTNDIDGNGHVNNTAYAVYFEQARALYAREMFDRDRQSPSIVVATLTIDYLAPVHLGDTVQIDVRVTDVGTSSWELEYRLRTQNGVAASGRSVQVAWNRQEGTSQELPTAWRTALLAAEETSE